MTFANFTSSRWLRALIFCAAIIPFSLATKSVGAADDPIRLQDDAPSRYTVKKGDTLWDIAGKFLRNPWQWPKIWGMNKKLIKDPHWIYPGDVIVLDRSGKFPRLTLERGGQAGPGGTATVKLSPRVRSTPLDAAAIPSIPPKAIEPFITRPLLVDKDMLAKSPVIVATEDRRFVVGEGSVAYVEGMSKEQGSNWYIYRPGNTFRDPDTDEILGYEAVHLGEARVTRFGKNDREASTIEIMDSKMEINKGDRLVPVPAEDVFAYIPHAPEKSVRGRILAAHEAVSELAWGQVVAISRGSRDGLERGHVLASMRLGEQVNSILREERGVVKRRETVGLPDEPTGLVFIFRTFDRVAYGLVVRSVHPLHVGDVVQTPER